MRILIVDDEPPMHDSYRRSFAGPRSSDGSALDAMAAELFGDDLDNSVADAPAFALTYCEQGLEAIAAVEQALADADPFAVAFIDVRMPPGIDGRETAKRIRALDPDVNIVIVTGFSDFSPVEISKVAGPADKIFYIAKPFEVAEILQTATALAQRWRNDCDLATARNLLAAQVVQLEEQAAELVPVALEELKRVQHDVTADELNRAKAQLRASVLMSLESTGSRCEQLARQLQVHGRIIDPEETKRKIAAVTIDEVQHAAMMIFRSRPTLAALGPAGKVPGLPSIVEKLAA